MNKKLLAKELVKVAQILVGVEFDTKEEMEEYKKNHDVKPGTKLTVKKDNKSNTGENRPMNSQEKKVVTSLKQLKEENADGYKELMNEYRDVLPHTGQEDVMVDSSKFEKWLKNQDEKEQGKLFSAIKKSLWK